MSQKWANKGNVNSVETCNQGVSRLGSRGNIEVSLMLGRPQNSMMTRSKPTPAPP